MILRINQFDPVSERLSSDWPDEGLTGPILAPWPDATRGFELSLLEADENNQPVALVDRQWEMRRLIPRIIQSLRSAEEWVVLRVDGPLAPGELARAFAIMIDQSLCDRYSFTGSDRLDPSFEPSTCSVRLLPVAGRLEEIVSDGNLGLHENVRLRAFALPEELVNPFLDTAGMDDERWREILPASTFCLSTSHGLSSVQIMTSRFDAEQIRQRVSGLQ